MDNTPTERVKALHTDAIDARNRYREALRDAEGHGMTTVFMDMIELHALPADELATVLAAAGEARMTRARS